MIKRLLAPAQRRRPDAICFCFVDRLSPQAKDLCGKLSTNEYYSFSRRRREKETERRKRTATKAGSAKTNRPDFFRGKQPVFPSGEKLKQEADANTLFLETRHSAVCVSQRSRTKERGLWFTPNEIFVPTKRKFFFREASHGEAYEKRIWSD